MSRPFITALYSVTPDTRFRTMAAASIYSLLHHRPLIPIRVTEAAAPTIEATGGVYGLSVKRFGLSEPVSTAWALFIDADTRVTADVNLLIPDDPKVIFCGRAETMYSRNRINNDNWAKVCEKADVPNTPVYNSGVWLLRGKYVQDLGDLWEHYLDWLPKNVADPLNPSEAKKRYPWWMLEQCALSLAVAKLPRLDWGKREHGFRWAGQGGGIIHHYSSKRWSSPL